MRLWVAAVAGLLLCGCSAGVTGRGQYDVNAVAPVSTTAAPTTTSATPTPTTPAPPPRYDGGRARLACAGGTVVTPKGGPYCYRLPPGMRDVTGKVQLGAGTGAAKYVSAMGLAGRDVIVVMVYRTPADSDLLPSPRIVSDLGPVLTSLTKAGFVFSSRVPRTGMVDRARAFSYHARSKDSSYQSDLTFVFRGRSQIEVLCQYATSPATMQRACGQLLASLQVRTVP
jgi:hypothetical protein